MRAWMCFLSSSSSCCGPRSLSLASRMTSVAPCGGGRSWQHLHRVVPAGPALGCFSAGSVHSQRTQAGVAITRFGVDFSGVPRDGLKEELSGLAR